MRYAVVEEINGVGNTHYEAMTEHKGWFGKTRWMTEAEFNFNRGGMVIQKFGTAEEALAHLRKKYVKIRKIVQDGEL